MNEAEAARALLKRLETRSYGSPKLPFAMPGVPFDPAATPSYLAVQFIPNRPALESLDAKGVVQMQGLLQVMVVAPKGGGIIKPMLIASAIQADWKRGTTVFDTSGLKVTVSGKPYLAGPTEDETRTSVPVLIPWQASSRA